MTRAKATGTTLSERKRRAILAHASRLFLDRGYPGTSMDTVAAAAGASKQTVYAQFSNKRALFRAVVHGLIGPAADAIQSAMDVVPPGATLAEHLTAYAVRQLKVVRTPRLMQLRRVAIAEAERFPDIGQALYEQGPERAIAGLSAAFERWASEGRLRSLDARVAASQFNWLVMGEPVSRAMLLGRSGVPTAMALRRHAHEAVSVFMSAYGPATARRDRRRAARG